MAVLKKKGMSPRLIPPLWFILLGLFLTLSAYAEPARDRSGQSPEPPEQAGTAGAGTAGAGGAEQNGAEQEVAGLPFLSVPASESRIVLIPEDPRPGEPVTIGFVGATGPEAESPGLRAVLINAQGRRLTGASFFTLAVDAGGRPLKAAVLAVPSTTVPGAAWIRVEAGTTVAGEAPLTIADRDFAHEEIPLNQGNTDIRTRPDPQKTAESETLWAIISRTGTEVHAAGPFSPPVGSTRRTSFFGDRRVYRYVNGSSDVAIHAGVDYGVPRGTPVLACAPGRVVLARFRIVTGNSVILEHLPGVYSIYYHLDTIAAAEGTMVDAGTVLGESGSTGLSTGPHLHWEIRVSGENADPDAFLARPVLDKEAIFRKINE
jgi:murein DD-endopeptidase MepM/ murein hydrolase activator NlpD